MASPSSRVRWLGGSLGPPIIGLAVLALILIVYGGGVIGANPSVPPSPSNPDATDAASPSEAPSASPSSSSQGLLTPGGVWFSELSYGQWVAGEVGPGRRLRLPAGVTPLAAGSGLVVTAVRSPSSTDLAVWDIKTGKTLAAPTVPFNVDAAAVATDGSTVYLAGVTGEQTIADAGVSAISIQNGEISEVLAGSPLRPEWEGNAARGALIISPTGKTLATALCGAPAGALDSSCDIAAVDLSTGSTIGRASTSALYLAAATDDTIVTRNQTSVAAFDLSGNLRWKFDAAEIRGPIASAADRVIIAYAPAGTVGPTRVATLSVTSGGATDVIVADGDHELSIWPSASDSTTVVVGEGPPMESAFGLAPPRVVLAAIDAATWRVSPNAVTITPEG